VHAVRGSTRAESLQTRATGQVHFPSGSETKGLRLQPHRHTCTLPAPGLGRSSSGLILERLLCMGSPVLLTADSLVGLFCCRQGFFPQKKTKLDCNKYVAPKRNMQHLLRNFIWRRHTVNYIGYAITLCFNYTALTCGREVLLNLVMEQGGNRKESI